MKQFYTIANYLWKITLSKITFSHSKQTQWNRSAFNIHWILACKCIVCSCLSCTTNEANNIQEHSIFHTTLPTQYALSCTMCVRCAHAYLLTLVFSTFSSAHNDNDDADNEHHYNSSHYDCNNNDEVFIIQLSPPAYLNCKTEQ